jgi:hypothetical protein
VSRRKRRWRECNGERGDWKWENSQCSSEETEKAGNVLKAEKLDVAGAVVVGAAVGAVVV